MVKLFTLNSGADLLLATQAKEESPVYINFSTQGKAAYTTPSEDELNEQNRTVFESEIYSRAENALVNSRTDTSENAVEYAVMKQLYLLIEKLVQETSEGYE
jgi:hypothetical protein